jgi:hypothetical protein
MRIEFDCYSIGLRRSLGKKRFFSMRSRGVYRAVGLYHYQTNFAILLSKEQKPRAGPIAKGKERARSSAAPCP